MRMKLSLAALAASLAIITPVLGDQEEAFLGLSTRKVDETLRAHLDLPEGVGLAVSGVIPGSPAEGKIEKDDVLTKFEDQLLINPEQLGVLVRSRKPGEKVKIENIRKSKKGVVEIELGKRPKGIAAGMGLPANIQILGPSIQSFVIGDDGDVMTANALDSNNIKDLIFEQLSKMDGTESNMTPEQISNIVKGIDFDVESLINQTAGGNNISSSMFASSVISSIMVDEKTGSILSYTVKDNKATLKITDKDGKKIFDGPVSTDKEKDQVPKEYRKVFDQMFKMEHGSVGDCSAVIKSLGTGSGSVKIDIGSETH